MPTDRPGSALAEEMQHLKKGSVILLYLLGGEIVKFEMGYVNLTKGITTGHRSPERSLATFRNSAVIGFVALPEDYGKKED